MPADWRSHSPGWLCSKQGRQVELTLIWWCGPPNQDKIHIAPSFNNFEIFEMYGGLMNDIV